MDLDQLFRRLVNRVRSPREIRGAAFDRFRVSDLLQLRADTAIQDDDIAHYEFVVNFSVRRGHCAHWGGHGCSSSISGSICSESYRICAPNCTTRGSVSSNQDGHMTDLPLPAPLDAPDDQSDLVRRHRASLFPSVGLNYTEPIELRYGERQYVYDGAGRQYLDFFGGIVTTSSGHAIPEITGPVKEQLDRIIHSSTLFLIRAQIELAERIKAMTPAKLNKLFFTNSATEANEAAFLVTTLNRSSNELIALRHSYYGRSFATINASGQRGWRSSSLSPLHVHYVGNPYCYRCPWEKTYPECDLLCARDVEAVIRTTTSGQRAAFIAEPVQGVGGFITPPPEYFVRVKEILDRYGIPFISDEVQTAWGRIGVADGG